MHATSIPHASQYYSQPNYTFYYTTSGRYCAYDPVSGNHFIHSLHDNRWYPYFPIQTFPAVQQKNHGYYPSCEYCECGQMKEAGYRDGYEGGRYSRGRDRHREEFLYSNAAAESARRSLLEEEIGMDYVYEEDLDGHGGPDWWNSSGFQHKRKTQRRDYGEPPYSRHHYGSAPQASPRHKHYAQPDQRHHSHEDRNAAEYQSSHHRRYRHHLHSSNRAFVGGPGSDHDSGYFEDFEPAEHPRDAMPGIARWLDSLDEGTVSGDARHPFDLEDDRFFEEGNPYYDTEEYSSRARFVPRKPMKERSYNSQPLRQEQRDSPTINITIDLDMDDYEDHCQQYTSSKQRSRHTAYEGSEHIIYQDGGEYDYYYEIPSAPPPPPPTDRIGRTPTKPRTVYQPNSIYSGPESVKMPTYTSGLPRAPSPPLSPLPHRRRTVGGERVRYVRPDPMPRGRRTW